MKTFAYCFFSLKIKKEGVGCHWATEMEVAFGLWLRKDVQPGIEVGQEAMCLQHGPRLEESGADERRP